jgi:hypothetical protein
MEWMGWMELERRHKVVQREERKHKERWLLREEREHRERYREV